jgi:hypothetical protein
MGFSPGEESLTAAVAVQAIEAQPAFGQIKPMRGKVLACAEQHLGDVPAGDRPTQEAMRSARKRKPGMQEGGRVLPRAQKTTQISDAPQSDGEVTRPSRSALQRAAIIALSRWRERFVQSLMIGRKKIIPNR